MNNELHRLSVLARPVDPPVVRVLRSLDLIARDVDCAYFVAGATARDLILANVHGLEKGRATLDLDFGVAVGSWTQFGVFKSRLVGTGDFADDRRSLQRLIYTDRTTSSSIPIDLIPFRGVESDEGTIAWPPGRDIVMRVAGFEEAFASSVSIEMDHGLTVRVASIPGLTLLKLTAWADRSQETNKDAADLYRLLAAYADAGNTDRLYGPELDLLEAVSFDMEIAGAELLGRDVASVGSSQLMAEVRSLLTSQPDFERLVRQMAQTKYAEAELAVERIAAGFRRGLLYRSKA